MTAEVARDAGPRDRNASRIWSPALTVRVLNITLWLFVISGPVAAAFVATRVTSLSERVDLVDIGAVEMPRDTSGAEGFAELFIAAYLTAGEPSTTDLSPFLDRTSPVRVETGSWSATRTMSLGAEHVAPGYYAVTVAAEVVAADSDGEGRPVWVPVGTLFYSVGVAETDSGWATTGLPSLIPAPVGATAPELLIDRRGGLDTAPGLEDMLSRFLAAFLAGDGELTRYTSPSSPILAIQPPPFVAAEILEVGNVETSDGVTQVVVVVRATDNAGRTQILEYALVVELRDGRWEVSRMLPAPPLAASSETN